MKEIWRWLLVLPAAIGTYIAVFLLYAIFSLLWDPSVMLAQFWGKEIGELVLLLLNTISGAIGFYFSIIAGSLTAPNRKFTVALVLASVGGCLLIGILVASIVTGISRYPVAVYVIDVFLSSAAMFIACLQIRSKFISSKSTMSSA
jgi:hypothetical protein